jgi:ethanolamine utilization protein EutN
MLLATVVGQVWATQKDDSLEGLRLIVVRPFVRNPEGGESPSAETMVAVDPLGVGTGERVLVVFGRAARHVIGRGHDIAFQTAVAAIVDGIEFEGESLGPSADADSHE